MVFCRPAGTEQVLRCWVLDRDPNGRGLMLASNGHVDGFAMERRTINVRRSAIYRCQTVIAAVLAMLVWGTILLPVGTPHVAAAPSGGVTPLVPARVLDTRPGQKTIDGQFQGQGARSAGSVLELQVTGRGGVPAAGIDAVMLNVTAVAPAARGYLTVFPCGSAQPNASNVNYVPGDVVPNMVFAKVGTGGKVCIYTRSTTGVLVDVSGYVEAGGSLGPVVPARVLDTRPGQKTIDGQFQGQGARSAGSVLELQVTGRGGVPAAGIDAVMLNVTAVAPAARGYLTVFPCGSAQPNASNVNYVPGDVVPNMVFAKVGTGGKVCIYTRSTTGVLVDVSGYVEAGGSLGPVVPARVLDTRPGQKTIDGQFQGQGARSAGSVLELQVTGRGGVPSAGIDAVMLNVTAVAPAARGYLTVFPCGSAQPNASNVNYVPGDVVPNMVFAKVGTGGKVCIYTRSTTGILVDVSGWAGSPTDSPFAADWCPSGTQMSARFPGRTLVSIGDECTFISTRSALKVDVKRYPNAGIVYSSIVDIVDEWRLAGRATEVRFHATRCSLEAMTLIDLENEGGPERLLAGDSEGFQRFDLSAYPVADVAPSELVAAFELVQCGL